MSPTERSVRAWFGIDTALSAHEVQAYAEEMVERWPRWCWDGEELRRVESVAVGLVRAGDVTRARELVFGRRA